MTKYQTLEAWKFSMQLVKEVYYFTRGFPANEAFGLISQIRRAVISIPCNIAEGAGRQYKKDTIQFLHIARGSTHEVLTLMEISLMIGIAKESDSQIIFQLIDKTLKTTNGLINYLKKSSLR